MSPSLTIPETITIRPADLADADQIAKLGATVFTITFGHSVVPQELEAYLNVAYTASAITEDLHDKTRDVIVATDSDGKILGFAYLARGTAEPCLAQVEEIVELQRIYVDTAAHGKGIGRLLSCRIDEMAREQGFKNIWLGVWENNHYAMRAYEKWGYRRCGSHEFVLGSVVQTDFVMVKSL